MPFSEKEIYGLVIAEVSEDCSYSRNILHDDATGQQSDADGSPLLHSDKGQI